MSADSPRRGVHKGVQVVSPQPIVDRSIIDSVAGIINDIVPQAYAGTPNSENKESISWARFEYADINDPALYPDYNEGSNTPPLLLVLGYTTGVQVWLIAQTGEATEVLSWWQGVVRTLRILPNPKTDDEHTDVFQSKRPMVAICDSAGPGPQFCNVSFISLKTGEQVKSIKFKNPVYDILANKRSIVVTFLEKIAVFDARTLEDVLTVTTCYASPGPNPNPVALGTRWFAYSEKKLLPAKRSSGGCEGEGVQSYTATVLYAAKSLGKGLRGLGETVASSLTGNSVSPVIINNTGSDVTQPGVITILDLQAAKEEKELDDANIETVVAHFTAHSDAIFAMTFDLSGALLMTADKRGHDFHVFRIQPHPGGPTLAAVHHLYILHRGDTTAKVQDMVFSSDTRWAAISTVRGTTHVFPVAPYGGPIGVRTHSTPHVVNRLSRFHRSAGLMDDGTRSHSPVSHTELPLSLYPYSNPRLPPYPHPTILHPLAQIRQPSSLNHVNSQAQQSRPQQRQRLHSDDSGTLPLKICACFAPPRAWMYAQREPTAKVMKRAVDSLFIMACHGNMIQYDLEPKPAAGVPKEKVCDDTMIELEVEAKGQWPLLRFPNSLEIVPPLSPSSPLLSVNTISKDIQDGDLAEDRWLSQVEIVTHAGPHRRLWMGPQFVFKTYNATSGAPVNLVEAEAVEIGITGGSRPARSNPVNMPHAASRSLVPVVIDGSGSSYEQSPRFVEAYGDSLDSENTRVGGGENQLREDLAEAMLETSIAPHRAPGRRSVFERVGQPVTKVVNPLGTVITVSADEEDIDSSQEFDSVDESYVPEPPRSVCAEEGPASLGDLEPESQTLRDLTEICAEMRSASEPTIDSVPDENIREVKEKKALCVEIAAISESGSTSIDFEKEEAFHDVPTNLSLCVEQGKIPSSPMTQAKQAVWCKRFDKRADKSAHEISKSEAQYVMNCDEDSVVLMENKLVHGRTVHCKTEDKQICESEIIIQKSGGNACRVETKALDKKYVLKEHEDSIVVENTTCEGSKNNCSKRKGCDKDTVDKESVKQIEGKSKGKQKSSLNQDCKEAKIKFDTESKTSRKRMEPVMKLERTKEKVGSNDDHNSMISIDVTSKEIDKYKSPPSDSTDEFSSSEYHIVETISCGKDNTLIQSDEDIEHIQSSELHQSECIDNDKYVDVISCTGSSPLMQRKNSKNTISDDDLEYIHSSELVEASNKACKEDLKLEDSDSNSATTRNKRAYSDDDLEHIQHSDVCSDGARDLHEKKKFQETEQSSKSKSSKRTRDIVVIDGDASAVDVTVIYKPVESWKTKDTERKEDSEECVAATEAHVNESTSPLRTAKTRSTKPSPSNVVPKRPQSGIEIIDIDAMQKAEMEVFVDVTSTPECQVLAGHEVCGTRLRKSRRNKKLHVESNVQSTVEALVESSKIVEETTRDSSQEEISEVSWSAIVKKKSGSPVMELENRTEDDKSAKIGGAVESVEVVKRTPILEMIDSIKRKVHESLSGTNPQVIDNLREAVTELDFEESPAQTEVSCSSTVKKRNVEHEVKQDSTFDLVVEKLNNEEGKTYDKCVESSSKSSSMIEQLREAVTEANVKECSTQPSSWSSIVKKKSSESASQLRNSHEKARRKLDPSSDSLETDSNQKLESFVDQSSENLVVECSTEESLKFSNSSINRASLKEKESMKSSKLPSSSVNRSSSKEKESAKSSKDSSSLVDQIFLEEKESTKSLQFETLSEINGKDVNEGKNSNVAEPIFLKEDFLEPERDTEKKSDSEQEAVPERSSSSDEMNANVVFMNAEGDYLKSEIAERNTTNGSTSVCATSKKSNKSKKKKRR